MNKCILVLTLNKPSRCVMSGPQRQKQMLVRSLQACEVERGLEEEEGGGGRERDLKQGGQEEEERHEEVGMIRGLRKRRAGKQDIDMRKSERDGRE